MQQIAIGLFAEGNTDYRYFSVFLERYITTYFITQGIDVDLQSPLHIYIKGKDFITSMKAIEENYSGLHAIFVHMDADSHNDENVQWRKWQPWLQQCKHRQKWIAMIPVRMLESWLLADQQALKKTFILKDDFLATYLGSRNVESIDNPKEILNQLIRLGKQKNTFDYHEVLAKRVAFQELERLSSFQKFQRAVAQSFQGYA
ncbi:MAG: hypothetical protein R2880_01730 [Deinococcales bacterium]